MTDRLYYTDPYLRAFDATIARVLPRGDRMAVWLDRTAFYPSSGGQPFDTGTLGQLRVVDVVDEEDGTIAHIVDARVDSAVQSRDSSAPSPESPAPSPDSAAPSLESPAPGQSMHCAIDWPRRFDHMQQHTGQHVLSASIARLFDVPTVSFHMGAAESTIDIARELSPQEIAAAESEANRVVWEDRPVSIRFATAEEAAAMPLRKEPAREGMLRLIDVDGFDLSACGGTHVARTGSIGLVAVASWERFKGGQRIAFLCGGRALAGYRTLRDAMTGAARLLSVLPPEMPASIERLLADAKEHKRAAVALQIELARYRAQDLAASAIGVSLEGDGAGSTGREVVRLVARAVDADANGLKTLATAIVAKPGYLVILVSTTMPALIAVARSADIRLSAQTLLTAVLAKFGGRGGGKPDFAQGGGLVASSADEIIESITRKL
jgi:alanyl-tRNA synthetase